MKNKDFEKLYNDSDFAARIGKLIKRYYYTYRKQFEIMGGDIDDLSQDVWITISESDTTDKPLLMRIAISRLLDLIKESKAQIHAVDDVDLTSLAYENENGEIETDDEVMARLVYSGRGRYV